MTRFKFPLALIFTIIVLLCGLSPASSPRPALAQQPTDTPPAQADLFVTVITTEPQINVRLGPSSTIYPIVGVLPTGSTVPAFGRSQGGDWIQIEFPSAPGGRGWVYSPLVAVSPPGVTLRVIAPPPTPIPPATSTIDPTLEAQFVIQPTATRLPTYTPGPTRESIRFEESGRFSMSFPWASIIIAFVVLGAIGFLLSSVRR